VAGADSGLEPRHDLRIQRAGRSSHCDDLVLVRSLNVAEPDLAQRPAGTHRRGFPLTGPRLKAVPDGMARHQRFAGVGSAAPMVNMRQATANLMATVG
jgi:hypothetical protein